MNLFSITTLPVLSGNLGLCPMPGKEGGLLADVSQIVAWKPDLVLTLLEQGEMTALGVAGLPEELRKASIGWRHLPIPDFGTPKGNGWEPLAKEISTLLARGGRVIIHCRAGCGRTGMIAARLMVAVGEPPEIALSRLRTARPCAIETKAQMRWAFAGAVS